jgi:polyisoprenoid-binding protein YceI
MTTTVEIPGYIAGTWTTDPVHSNVSFTVRHMMVSKVRGRFSRFEGEIVTAPNPLDSRVTATIDLDSIDTGNPQRDDDMRSANYLEIETHPEMTFRSTGIRQVGDRFAVEGELSLHGVTRPVELELEVNGFTKDPFGGTRSGFSARTEIDRRDFGITTNMPMDGGGVVVGEKIQINIEIEAVLKEEASASGS